MSDYDYDEVVRVLSFNVAGITRNAQAVPSNPPVDTTLAKAIRTICDGDWESSGNRLGALLRDSHPAILDMDEVREIRKREDFPAV